MNVRIENMNKMGIVSPLEREQSLSTPLMDDGRKDNVLEGLEVNDTLGLDSTIMKRIARGWLSLTLLHHVLFLRAQSQQQ